MADLSERQMGALRSLARDFASYYVLGSVGSLVKRGLVEDLGLYDHENKTKRYGSHRYRVTAAGHLLLKKAAGGA